MHKQNFQIILLAILLLFWPAKSALAYIDPGSGSFIIQIVAGILIGTSLTTKTVIRKIRSMIGKRSPKTDSKKTTNDEIKSN